MTHDRMNSFVGDLVQMAQAFEELPQVRHDLMEAKQQIEHKREHIQHLELTIIGLKEGREELHSRIRDLEAKLDASETMFLEADERTSRALDFIKATFGNAGSLIQALEPQRAPEVTPPAEPPQAQDHVEPQMVDLMAEAPLVAQGESASPSTSTGESTSHDNPPSSSDEVSVQSSPTPAPAAPTGTGTESAQSDSSEVTAKPPYAGRNYIDVPGWISRSDWLAGGGTDESYDYRPSRSYIRGETESH